MLSSKQFAESLDFLETHQDALKCVDQIAERRQTYNHYQATAGTLVAAMAQNQIGVSGSSVSGGANKEEFEYVKAFAKASEVFAKYKFSGASSKDELLKMVTKA